MNNLVSSNDEIEVPIEGSEVNVCPLKKGNAMNPIFIIYFKNGEKKECKDISKLISELMDVGMPRKYRMEVTLWANRRIKLLKEQTKSTKIKLAGKVLGKEVCVEIGGDESGKV